MSKIAWITELTLWIEDNLENQLSSDIIATRAGYSKRHTEAVFKQTWSIPMGRYVRRRRLIASAGDLLAGGITIIDVAFKYHFNCQQTFSRAFKREFSVTPGEVKNKRIPEPILNKLLQETAWPPALVETPDTASPLFNTALGDAVKVCGDVVKSEIR